MFAWSVCSLSSFLFIRQSRYHLLCSKQKAFEYLLTVRRNRALVLRQLFGKWYEGKARWYGLPIYERTARDAIMRTSLLIRLTVWVKFPVTGVVNYAYHEPVDFRVNA